jgi:hypothetical protein
MSAVASGAATSAAAARVADVARQLLAHQHRLRTDLVAVGERLTLALIALGLFLAGALLVPAESPSRNLLDLPWLTPLAFGVGTWLSIIVVRGARAALRR